MTAVNEIEIPDLPALRWELYGHLASADAATTDRRHWRRLRWLEERIAELQRDELAFRAFAYSYVRASLLHRRLH
ncbi:hypothetical protein [Halochromatium roseum]|uniref:hypothetical protein n=1 Tax=Halochromatium roseum TaxID=391920 RepID=UPI001912A54C|nr:hypothetical protein [Halochromatium roseum]MBK5938126.1 hypothetical protein [Halochromatium roseum]